MRYIKDLKEGVSVREVYLCRKRQFLTTKNGKNYESLTLQDKTGSLDAKIWEPDSAGIGDFEELDYIFVVGDVTSFQGHLQMNIRQLRRSREGEYEPSDYLPSTARNIDDMMSMLLKYVETVKTEPLHRLLTAFFVEDEDFVKDFRFSSAAKSIHHGFVGGLLEHTIGVTGLCYFYCKMYPFLKRDLLITSALLHDIGKTRELSRFPRNDYTDEGQFIGHIIIGISMIDEKIREIPDFPEMLAMELRHCILAHHGELEFGSPKKPALIEAAALHLADNTDAKIETFKEALDTGNAPGSDGWLGYQPLLESNIHRTIL